MSDPTIILTRVCKRRQVRGWRGQGQIIMAQATGIRTITVMATHIIPIRIGDPSGASVRSFSVVVVGAGEAVGANRIRSAINARTPSRLRQVTRWRSRRAWDGARPARQRDPI